MVLELWVVEVRRQERVAQMRVPGNNCGEMELEDKFISVQRNSETMCSSLFIYVCFI